MLWPADATRGQVLRSALAEPAALGAVTSVAGVAIGGVVSIALRGVISLLGGMLPGRAAREPEPLSDHLVFQ